MSKFEGWIKACGEFGKYIYELESSGKVKMYMTSSHNDRCIYIKEGQDYYIDGKKFHNPHSSRFVLNIPDDRVYHVWNDDDWFCCKNYKECYEKYLEVRRSYE